MPNRFRFNISMLLCACLVVVLAGCGDGRPERVAVSGKVTIDGQVLTEGSIKFKPAAGGRPGTGSINSEGRYSITTYTKDDGLPPGDYIVAISANTAVSNTEIRWLAPKRYSLPKQSKLTAKVEEETDSMDFALSWEESESEHSEPWIEGF